MGKKRCWERGAVQLTKKARLAEAYKVLPLLSELNSKEFRVRGFLPNVIFYEKNNISHAEVGKRVERWIKKHFIKSPKKEA